MNLTLNLRRRRALRRTPAGLLRDYSAIVHRITDDQATRGSFWTMRQWR